MSFAEGTEVIYNGNQGFISFVCDKYITVCIKTFDEKSRDVCLLVYPNQWKDVHLLKQSEK
jgi:hypothetical protein